MSWRVGPPPCPLGASEYARSVHGYFGIATCRSQDRQVPILLVRERPPRLARLHPALAAAVGAARDRDLAPINVRKAAATSAASHCVSRISTSRRLIRIVPFGASTEPVGPPASAAGSRPS